MASRAALFEPVQTVVAKPSPTPLGTARFPDEHEDRVWLRLLALPFATMSVFLVALFGTGIGWFILPALVFGPGGGILAIVYLALTRDANAEAGPRPETESVAVRSRTILAMPAHPGARQPPSISTEETRR